MFRLVEQISVETGRWLCQEFHTYTKKMNVSYCRGALSIANIRSAAQETSL